MKYAFINAQEVAFPVQAMCQALGVSRSGYYDWKERPEPRADAATVALSAEITAAHSAAAERTAALASIASCGREVSESVGSA